MENNNKSESQKQKQLYATSLGSSLASAIAKFITHPIDTVKAKVQVSRTKLHNISDLKVGYAFNLAKQTVKNQGVPGLYRGLSISIIGSSFAFSLYMSAYQKAKDFFMHKPFFQSHPSIAHLVSGFLAQIVSCSLWLPIDIIKQRLQVQSQVKIYSYKGPIEAIKKINISEGLIGLYRAFGATLLFFGPFSAIFFMCFQKMKDLVTKNRDRPSLTQSIICSSTAGAFAGWITTPLELVKLRMQIQRADIGIKGGSLQNSIFGYKNAFHGLYLITKNEGFYALYKGALLRICFSVPMTTLSLTLTQMFKQRILESQLLQGWI